MKSNDRDDGSVLDQQNKLIYQRRKDVLDRLWNDDVPVTLQIGHADTSCGFHLPFIDRLQTGTGMLGDVHGTVDRKRQYGGPELRQLCGDAVIDDEDLDHDRNAADKVDPAIDNGADDPVILYPDHPYKYTQDGREDQCPESKL